MPWCSQAELTVLHGRVAEVEAAGAAAQVASDSELARIKDVYEVRGREVLHCSIDWFFVEASKSTALID